MRERYARIPMILGSSFTHSFLELYAHFFGCLHSSFLGASVLAR